MRSFVLSLFCIAYATGASAQTVPDLAGTWRLIADIRLKDEFSNPVHMTDASGRVRNTVAEPLKFDLTFTIPSRSLPTTSASIKIPSPVRYPESVVRISYDPNMACTLSVVVEYHTAHSYYIAEAPLVACPEKINERRAPQPIHGPMNIRVIQGKHIQYGAVEPVLRRQ